MSRPSQPSTPSQLRPPLVDLEICVDSLAGLRIAAASGATRVELCSALDLGGLSPSLGLLQAAVEVSCDVHVMIRPRAGDFRYTAEEVAVMRHEIAQVRDLGLAGVVIGAGGGEGLDYATLDQLCRAASGLSITLHRVVDLLPDRYAPLQRVTDLGINRILTSGGAKHAQDGLDDIAAQVANAPDGLRIMPGSGVKAENAAQILSTTGARDLHASARRPIGAAMDQEVALGFATGARQEPDPVTIRALAKICRKANPATTTRKTR